MLTKVDHIDLKVPNLEQSVAFLKSIGLVEKRRSEARGSVELQLPGEDQVVFELRLHNSDKTVLNHVAFRVEIQDDVEALEAQGIVFKNKHKLIADTGRTVSGIMDYSGLNWQLTD